MSIHQGLNMNHIRDAILMLDGSRCSNMIPTWPLEVLLTNKTGAQPLGSNGVVTMHSQLLNDTS